MYKLQVILVNEQSTSGYDVQMLTCPECNGELVFTEVVRISATQIVPIATRDNKNCKTCNGFGYVYKRIK